MVLSAPTTPYGLERLNLFAVVVDRHVADVVDAALSVPGLVEGFPGPVTLIKVLRNSRHVGSLGVGLRCTRVQKGRGLRGSGPPVRLSVLTFTDRTGYRMRTLGACPVCAHLHPARPPGRSPLRSHRRTSASFRPSAPVPWTGAFSRSVSFWTFVRRLPISVRVSVLPRIQARLASSCHLLDSLRSTQHM